MKNINTNHNESNPGSNQSSTSAEVSPKELAVAQRWWAALESADRIAAFEVAVIVQALKGGAGHNRLAGEVELKRAYKAFLRELHKTFEERPEVLMHFYDPRPELGISTTLGTAPFPNAAESYPDGAKHGDKWFASLPKHEQEFALELWKMIERADDNHVIEVKTVGDRLRATLIYLLKRPTRKKRGIRLPLPPCGWN